MALLLAVSMLLSACLSEAEPTQLSVYGPYVGAEADIFAEALASFEEQSGITVSYVGSASFQADFAERINTGDLADITVLPQPSLLSPLREEGRVAELDPELAEEVASTTGEFWSEFTAPDGVVSAVPYRFVVKSIVWYRSDVFAEQGYAVPDTLAELQALTRRMVADGLTPWCSGMDSASATGWWATDWVEDLMIRGSGEQAYRAWSSLQLPFTAGAVVDAMRRFQDLVNTDGAFAGGRRAILDVGVERAMDPMFDEDPACVMHKQASFQQVWLPDGVEVGDGTLDVFALPGFTAGEPPMMISGEVVVATSESEAAIRFLEFLLTDAAIAPWLDTGGSLVARAADGGEEGELDRRLAEMVARAETIVLDASDLMAPSVGTGSFFDGMIDLVAGRSPSGVAADIQETVDALPRR